MADKQLTVAELMARAQKENPDAQPRRRRRRSLDEGGVSVAELTGSLRAIDAAPPESKHSSVPLDAESDKPAAAKSVSAPKPEATAVTKAEQATKPDPAKKPEQPTQSAKTEKAAPATSVKVEPATPAQPKPELKEAQKPESPKAEKSKDAAPTRPGFKAVAPQPSKTEQTGPITRVVTLDEKGEGDVDKRASSAELSDAEITQESPVVRDEHVPDEHVTEEAAPQADDQELLEEDNSVNPILLVLLVFAGLVVGVLMFLGFQYLWESYNPILVGVLALAVTGGVVLLVRAMKTGRDAVTMTLAAIAGAAMTFGPALVSAI